MGQEQGKLLTDDDVRKADIAKMDAEMSRKMGRGVDWNLKVLIRGARSTGKSCLFQRLQGGSFFEEYSPTPRIGVAHIHWSYKTLNDIVKVEVWDVVDVAKQLNKSDSLKITTDASPTPPADTTLELDANTVDVMRGTHAVVMCYDPRKRWTWEYIEKEVPNVLAHNIHILVLENYRDLVSDADAAQEANRRQVNEAEARQFCDLSGPLVSFAQASMKNCYGLKSVKTFLNLPFLAMQKQSLEAKLRRNSDETQQTLEEFRIITEEQDYDSYLTWLNNRTKALPTDGPAAPQPPASTPTLSVASQPSPTLRQIASSSPGPAVHTAKAAVSSRPSTPKSAAEAEKEAARAAAALVEQIRKEQGLPPKKEEKKGFFSSIFSKLSGDEEERKSTPPPKKTPQSEDPVSAIKKLQTVTSSSASVDDFRPDVDDDDWLSGPDPTITASAQKHSSDDDEDDDSNSNPMVAADVDVDVGAPIARPISTTVLPPKPTSPAVAVHSASPSSVPNKTTPMTIPVKSPKPTPAAPPPSAASYSPVVSPAGEKLPVSVSPSSPVRDIAPKIDEELSSSPSVNDAPLSVSPDLSVTLDSFLEDETDVVVPVLKSAIHNDDSDDEQIARPALIAENDHDSVPPVVSAAPSSRRNRNTSRQPTTSVVSVPSHKKKPAQDSEALRAIAASLAADWDSTVSTIPTSSPSSTTIKSTKLDTSVPSQGTRSSESDQIRHMQPESDMEDWLADSEPKHKGTTIASGPYESL